MDIGIIGVGVVGGAIKYAFEKLGHNVKTHDKKDQTTVDGVLSTKICYICVPTPPIDDGNCDISIVESVVGQLNDLKYNGIIAIKSTVIPGTTDYLQEKYQNLELSFVPEFLRERCAVADFIENHDLCIIGTKSADTFKVLKDSHGRYPHLFVQLAPLEAEICKYFNNIYNATLITFANSFYEVCKKHSVDYSKIKNAMINRNHISDLYLDCNENFRGFGGACLPKDLKAMSVFCKDEGINVDFFDAILKENLKYKVTVFKNMRKYNG